MLCIPQTSKISRFMNISSIVHEPIAKICCVTFSIDWDKEKVTRNYLRNGMLNSDENYCTFQFMCMKSSTCYGSFILHGTRNRNGTETGTSNDWFK